MNLYKHQQEFLKLNPDKSALVWSCGTGKTRTAIEWAKTTQNRNTLIICPKALKANWQREILKYGFVEHGYYVKTKEEFRRDWDILDFCHNVIVDEVHNGFLTPHFKSQMSKALRNYIKKHKVPRVLLLSATVYTSSPWNIYNLALLLGYKWDWNKFNYTFFDQIRMGQRVVPVPKKNITKNLAELTKKIASVVSLEECIDVPQQTFENEYFDLNKEQIKAIEENYDPLPIVRFTAHHQISNGVLKGNEFSGSKIYESDKNKRIKELALENKKIIFVCRYNEQIDVISEILKEYNPLIIRGNVKDRDSVVQEANNRDEAVVIIQSSCSMGYELQTFRIMVFVSMDFSFSHYKQMIGRTLRINNPQKNLYLHLLCGDMDQAIMDAISNKKDFDINLYEKR